MAQVTAVLLDLLQNAWVALSGGLAAMVLLALLAQSLRQLHLWRGKLWAKTEGNGCK